MKKFVIVTIFTVCAIFPSLIFSQSSGVTPPPPPACSSSNAGALYTNTSTSPATVYTCSYYNLSWQWIVNPSYGGIVYYPTLPTTCSGALPVFEAGWPDTKMYVCVHGVPNLVGGGSGGITSVTATSPVISSGGAAPVISMHVADSTDDGYLSSAYWNIFNSKEPALGNPSVDGKILSSTADGVRSWISVPIGVSKIIAGSNVTISPLGGTGIVTVNSSGGTVNPGTTGQVAYYPGNGTTVSGENTVPLTAGGTGCSTAPCAWSAITGGTQTGSGASQVNGLPGSLVAATGAQGIVAFSSLAGLQTAYDNYCPVTGCTMQLLADTTSASAATLTLNGTGFPGLGQPAIIDLGGHTVTFTGTSGYALTVTDGGQYYYEKKVIKNGTIVCTGGGTAGGIEITQLVMVHLGPDLKIQGCQGIQLEEDRSYDVAIDNVDIFSGGVGFQSDISTQTSLDQVHIDGNVTCMNLNSAGTHHIHDSLCQSNTGTSAVNIKAVAGVGIVSSVAFTNNHFENNGWGGTCPGATCPTIFTFDTNTGGLTSSIRNLDLEDNIMGRGQTLGVPIGTYYTLIGSGTVIPLTLKNNGYDSPLGTATVTGFTANNTIFSEDGEQIQLYPAAALNVNGHTGLELYPPGATNDYNFYNNGGALFFYDWTDGNAPATYYPGASPSWNFLGTGNFPKGLNLGSNTLAANLYASFNSATEYLSGHLYYRGGIQRWFVGMDTTAETGSNAGSDLVWFPYSDTGDPLGTSNNWILYRTSSSGYSQLSGPSLSITNNIFGGQLITATDTGRISAVGMEVANDKQFCNSTTTSSGSTVDTCFGYKSSGVAQIFIGSSGYGAPVYLGGLLAGQFFSAAGTALPTCEYTQIGQKWVSDAVSLYGPYVSGGTYYGEVQCIYNGSSYSWQMFNSGATPAATTSVTGVVSTDAGGTLSNTAGAIAVAKVPNAVTFAATGGAAPSTTFNGSAARTVSASTVGAPQVVYSTPYAATMLAAGGTITTLTMVASVGADTNYEFEVNASETTVGSGGTCSTQGSSYLGLNYTDADSSVAVSGQTNVGMYASSSGITIASTQAAGSSLGVATVWNSNKRTFRAKAGSAITLTVGQFTGSNCTITPVIEYRPLLWSLPG